MGSNQNVRVYIDPTSRIRYASFYIQGLYEVFGRRNFMFSRKPFKDLPRRADRYAYEHYMAFVVQGADAQQRRVVIDFADGPDVLEAAYRWSDRYGKINVPYHSVGGVQRDNCLSFRQGLV